MQFAAAESQFWFFFLQRNPRTKGFVVLNVIRRRLFDSLHVIMVVPPPPPVHPVRNAVLKCRSETACSPVSLTLLDAVCSYLCLITISMFYSVCLHSSRQMLNYSERAECKRWQRRQQETYSSFCFSSWKKTLSKLFDGQQQVWGEKGGQTQKKSVRLKDKIIKVIFFFHGIDLILLKLLQVSLYKSFIKSVKT